MPSPHWRTRLLQHTCDIWRPGSITFDASGEPNTPAYTKVGSDVPCYFKLGGNISAPVPQGPQGDTDYAMTFDYCFLAPDTNIEFGDYVKNTTAGSPGQGQFYVTRGNPRRMGDLGAVKHSRKEIAITFVEAVPGGVS